MNSLYERIKSEFCVQTVTTPVPNWTQKATPCNNNENQFCGQTETPLVTEWTQNVPSEKPLLSKSCKKKKNCGHLSLAREKEKRRHTPFSNVKSKNISPYARASTKRTQNKCLGKECEFSGYKTMDNECLFLWCGQQEVAVIDLNACPEGKWMKDEKGFPIPDKSLK